MIRELLQLRDRTHVFKGRRQAGEALAGMLAGGLPANAKILAIPAGGVPVAAAMAQVLRLPLDVLVVSKVTPARQSEVGYGAVAFDGRIRVDEARRAQLGVDAKDVERDVERTAAKVRWRVEHLREGRGPVVAAGDTVVLVDDGLASGLTMETAAEAARAAGAARIVVAVPTAPETTAKRLAAAVDGVYCANVRTGRSFAVADAYESWFDLGDEEVLEILNRLRQADPR
jgi:predicted phosphoribosyltransferase